MNVSCTFFLKITSNFFVDSWVADSMHILAKPIIRVDYILLYLLRCHDYGNEFQKKKSKNLFTEYLFSFEKSCLIFAHGHLFWSVELSLRNDSR